MSNAFDKASLVMLPHAYEEGKLYSLKPTDRSGDFTFSRGADTATRVGEDGYIKKEHSNLVLQSNNFNTTWTGPSTIRTSGQSGYDGSNDAWLYEKQSTYSSVRQDVSYSGVGTYSVYAKAGTLDWIRMGSNIGAVSCYFDIQNGVVGNKGTSVIDAKIEAVGTDGWYRCFLAFNDSISVIQILPTEGSAMFTPTSGSIYIQDAQLNQGLVATPYLETTTAPVFGGLTDNMPRLDYTDATCPSLLLEPSRTNLIAYSELMEPDYCTRFGITFKANATLILNYGKVSKDVKTNNTLMNLRSIHYLIELWNPLNSGNAFFIVFG